VRQAAQGHQSAVWFKTLEDPQILVNISVQNRFLTQLHHLGLDGGSFIEAARLSLVGAVHSGVALALLVAIIALVWVRRVPFISLSRRATVTVPAGE
jgi:hypothetical protein